MSPTEKVTKGFSLPREMCEKVNVKAKAERRSFSFIVRRALERELESATKNETPHQESQDELISIHDAAQLLRLSVSRVRTRSRKKGDPIRAARSRVGKLKPMHFHRSMLKDLAPR